MSPNSLPGTSGIDRAQVLPGADWDLISAINNAANYLGLIGGALVILLGTALLIWAVILAVKKFMSTQPTQDGWGKIIVMVIVAGAIGSVGGWALVKAISGGGKKTVEDLGGGTWLLDNAHLLDNVGLLISSF